MSAAPERGPAIPAARAIRRGDGPPDNGALGQPVTRRHDLASLRARRERARRNGRIARMDLAIGVALAILLLLLSPGLAIAGLIALIALLACSASFGAGRARRRRARRGTDVRRR